jgi:hypothetical protein
MDDINALFKRIISEPLCTAHKPVVELKHGRPYWCCLRCGEVWPMRTGKREEGKGG